MKKYWHLAISMIHLDTAYPAWYWSHLIVFFGKLVLMVSFWEAVFDGREMVDGWTLPGMITYIVLAIMLHEYTSGASWELSHMIRQGQVAVELLRPYDILWRLLAQDIGKSVSNALRTAVPLVLFMALVFPMRGPAEPMIWLIVPVTVLMAILIGGMIDLTIGLFAFWLDNMWGLRVFKTGMMLFFSGALIPVNLMPDWMQSVLLWTPFPSMVYTPVAIFTGQYTGEMLWTALGMQLIWLAVVLVMMRSLWRFAIRQVTVFGG